MTPILRSVLTAAVLAAAPAAARAQAPEAAAPVGAAVDYHVHVKGDLTLEEALRRSRESGIRYGIAVNGGVGFPAGTDADLAAFLRETDGLPVYRALQAEGREWVRLFSPGVMARFDYVFTDAMTWTDGRGRRMRLWVPEEVGTIDDPQGFMDTLVDRAVTIFEREPIDLYVNPTFVPAVLQADYERLWTPARMERVVRALAAHGIGLEINNRYRIPSAAFIRLATAAGVKVACGTNNTGAADLGRNEYCAAMIRECGLGPGDFWTPPAPGRKAVERRPPGP